MGDNIKRRPGNPNKPIKDSLPVAKPGVGFVPPEASTATAFKPVIPKQIKAKDLIEDTKIIVHAEIQRMKHKVINSNQTLIRAEVQSLTDHTENIVKLAKEEREQGKLSEFDKMTDDQLKEALKTMLVENFSDYDYESIIKHCLKVRPIDLTKADEDDIIPDNEEQNDDE